MHTTSAHLIYWLPPGTHFETGGNAASDTRYENLLQRFVTDVGSTGLFEMLSQYPDSAGAPTSVAFGGSYTYTAPYPSSKGTTANPLLDSDIQHAISSLLAGDAGGPGWTPSLNDVFFVFTGTGVQSCLQSNFGQCTFYAALDGGGNQTYGAYHAAYSLKLGNGTEAPVIYANMPAAASINYYASAPAYPNDPLADPTVTAMSHELFESITDPVLNAWQGPNGGCDEIADKCNLRMGPLNSDGSNLILPNGDRYVIQQEWSNAIATQSGESLGCTLGIPQCAVSYTCTGDDANSNEVASFFCVNQPAVAEQQASGAWSPLSNPLESWYDLGDSVAALYGIGTQAAGINTGGAPIGSEETLKACISATAPATCDPPTNITVTNCCNPVTACPAGVCGSYSNGCGGWLPCGGCGAGLTCYNNVCEKCVPHSCPSGYYFDETTCECAKDFCACGGVYPRCKVCQ